LIKNPEFVGKLDSLGSVTVYKGPAEYKEFFRTKWRVTAEILEQLGMKKYPGKID
jgi:hypothetical protein